MLRPLLLAAALLAAPAYAQTPKTAEAYFAGGCFWCVEHDFEKIPGVIEAVSGYTGGKEQNPTYKQVSSETTGHYEAVRVVYDPAKVSYRTLVDRFWRLVDPTDAGGQFCDRGPSYRTAIFVAPEQTADAQASKVAAQSALEAPIATPVLPLFTFWPAEDYHQDYAKKNPVQYRFYRTGCGRDARLRQVWGSAKS
jgi:peptide-methionine (S)-S-oxide reductase